MSIEEIQSSSQASESDSPTAMGVQGDGKEERIDVPGENDVLCGRGGSINSHKGNEQFRDLVEKRKRVYLTARFKREKRLIASSIVSEIRGMDPPGRFLSRKGNKDEGYWYDIGDEKARDKTSQALRENAPSIRAEIETEINQQRAEMKRKDVEEQAQKQPPSSFPPTPHYYPQQQQQQSYWDWYYRYYNYGPTPIPPHYPPPPHASAGSSPVPPHPGAVPPHQPAAYYGQPPLVASAPVREKTGEEFKEESFSRMDIQEEHDHRMAMELQHQENAEAYAARKARYKKATISSAALGPVFPTAHRERPVAKLSKVDRPSPFDAMDNPDLSQEERDHRLAVALQEQEDNALRHQLDASGDVSRRTSRSNAFSQVTRASTQSSQSYGSLEQVVPASFVAWVTADTGLKHKPSERQRSVQFKDDKRFGQNANQPPEMQRQSSVASVETRPLQPQAEPNTSLLSQVATHILGSWEGSSSTVQHENGPDGQDLKPHATGNSDEMETEGLEVQLRDARDETSMPPPDPRVQIDWPSRVGSCHTWIPETLGAAWGGASNPTGMGSGHHGISPVNSLEMDGSANIEHGSVGGGSLCQIFEQDESLQRALREVPSWERSMRSKSPLSMTSMDGDSASLIRVRDLKPSRLPPPPIPDSDSVDMDWEGHPEQG